MVHSLFTISLSLFFLFHGCVVAQLELQQQQFWQNLNQQQQHRLRAKTRCRIGQLSAREPQQTFVHEAGVTEYWDANNEEFECAGVRVLRHTIESKGLLLPYYSNAPQLVYVVQGRGILGSVFPGCAETYESESRSQGRHETERGESRTRADRHQKLRRIQQGDILALPQGITHWAYNDGETPIITVALLDVANENNQLDLQFRKYFLAGNYPQESESQQGGQRGERQRGQHEQQERGSNGNIFSGFDEDILSEIFQDAESETIRKLQSREDNRGIIVRAERLRLMLPEYSSEEQERQREQEQETGTGGRYNGIEETFCTLKIRQNIDHPTKSDVYNPRGGRISTINSQSLPILSYLRLSAERGVLYRNAILAPQWSTNSHCVMYVTRGSARVQVVGDQGKSVFNEEVNQGQLLIVPQNFVVVKKASEEGFEWITFKTNDNAMNAQLAGRLSVLRSWPEELVMNAFDISRHEARTLKYSRDEATLFSPVSSSRSEESEA